MAQSRGFGAPGHLRCCAFQSCAQAFGSQAGRAGTRTAVALAPATRTGSGGFCSHELLADNSEPFHRDRSCRPVRQQLGRKPIGPLTRVLERRIINEVHHLVHRPSRFGRRRSGGAAELLESRRVSGDAVPDRRLCATVILVGRGHHSLRNPRWLHSRGSARHPTGHRPLKQRDCYPVAAPRLRK